jgi:hypothetical protein
MQISGCYILPLRAKIRCDRWSDPEISSLTALTKAFQGRSVEAFGEGSGDALVAALDEWLAGHPSSEMYGSIPYSSPRPQEGMLITTQYIDRLGRQSTKSRP